MMLKQHLQVLLVKPLTRKIHNQNNNALLIFSSFVHHENASIYRLCEAQPRWLYLGLVEDMALTFVISPLDAT
jgi:hypothetical protein